MTTTATPLLNGFTTADFDAIDWTEGEGFYQFQEDDECDPDHDFWVYHSSGVIEKAVAPRDWFNDEEWKERFISIICEAEGWDPADVIHTAVQG